MTIDEQTKKRVLVKQRDFSQNAQSSINLTEFEQGLAGLTKEALLKEQEKLNKKIKLQYIVVNPVLPVYHVEEVNIADNPEQKNRVWLRKNVAFATGVLSGIFKEIGVSSEEFSGFMGYVRDKFLETVYVPHIAEITLKGKTVPLADKLTMSGLKAYRRYLLFLCDNLEHSCYVKGGDNSMDFQIAVVDALAKEMEVDDDLNREQFFTTYFLPKSVDACYKNMLKEKTISEKLKKDFGFEKQSNVEDEERTK
ncbi:MAG: hypothetical protein J6T39_02705 [Clostridia bacterium]|nr:hypothetical protein [Clostridia bacterium]